MRKFLLFMLVAVMLTACGNDDEPTPATDLNVKQLADYVGETAEYVKSDFKSGELITEGGTLGKTTLSYFLYTKSIKYSITFKTDAKGIISDVNVYASFTTYKEGIETFKTEMDKVNATIEHVSYIAYYNSKSAGLMGFNDRNEFWEYVAENDVSTFIWEKWNLSDNALVSFNIDSKFSRSNNSISIDIERKEW